MSQEDVTERVTKVAASILGLDPGDIQPSSNFIFDLGAESSQSVELVMAFEAEFDIEMDQEKALAVQTVEDTARFIAEYL
ncbi:MAG: acyl carrier protein [Planctomycetota bacterium]|jgi:acyl carrier protein